MSKDKKLDWPERCHRMAKVRDTLNVSPSVATELLVLAGWDVEMVINCSKNSNGLNECKSKIIDARFTKIERKKDAEEARWKQALDQRAKDLNKERDAYYAGRNDLEQFDS